MCVCVCLLGGGVSIIDTVFGKNIFSTMDIPVNYNHLSFQSLGELHLNLHLPKKT